MRIKVTSEKDQVVVAKAYDAGQEHIFRFWDELDDDARRRLLDQVADVDFQLMHKLTEQFVLGGEKSRLFKTLAPPKSVSLSGPNVDPDRIKAAAEAGENAIRDGRIAAVMVAGGQATRLGFNGPKGTYPIGPITGNSLFQIHAEKISAMRKRYKARIPLYIMTSVDNDKAIREFFDANSYFGLSKNTVSFFIQGMIPAVDSRGKLLLTGKDTIFRNPDGHGGLLKALDENGMIEDMASRGTTDLFYFQVDNPLVKIADPAFVGEHVLSSSELSLKSIIKRDADEKVGLIGMRDGKLAVIEYIDVADEEMRALDTKGDLVLKHANPAIHIISLSFIERVLKSDLNLEYHATRKLIPYLDRNGNIVTTDEPNGIKFEMFIFDALPFAKKTLVVESDRRDEFSPVKNASGLDSPDEARRAMANLFGRWLHDAGVAIPRDGDGNVEGKIEISPSFALDAGELAAKVDTDISFSGALLLS